MNAQELFLSDGRAANVFYCEKCRVVHKEKSLADACCSPVICCECKINVCEKYYIACPDCVAKKRELREQERFDNALKIEEKDWGYPVFSEGGDFYSSIEDYQTYCEDNDEPIGKFVWSSIKKPFIDLSFRKVSRLFDDGEVEDAEYMHKHIKGKEELITALSAFNEINKELYWWEMNTKSAVTLTDSV